MQLFIIQLHIALTLNQRIIMNASIILMLNSKRYVDVLNIMYSLYFLYNVIIIEYYYYYYSAECFK